ncbi:hypothetical protein EMIT0180MI3_20593 [Priestia megaterium]
MSDQNICFSCEVIRLLKLLLSIPKRNQSLHEAKYLPFTVALEKFLSALYYLYTTFQLN